MNPAVNTRKFPNSSWRNPFDDGSHAIGLGYGTNGLVPHKHRGDGPGVIRFLWTYLGRLAWMFS